MQINLGTKTFAIEHLKAVDSGEKKLPIFILHGFPDKANSWTNLGNYFQRIGYDVYLPTLRGYYPSYSPKNIEAYQLDDLANDILEMMDYFKYEQIILIGHDWGGMLAWHFTHLNPGKVEKIATISVPHPISFQKMLKTNPKQWLKSWYIFFFKVPFLAESFLAKSNFRNLKGALRKGCKERVFTKEEKISFVASWKDQAQLSTMLNWYRALSMNFKTTRYQNFDGISLQVIGDSDPYFTAEAFNEKCSKLKIQEKTVFKNCGHWPHFEKPTELEEVLKLFLERT